MPKIKHNAVAKHDCKLAETVREIKAGYVYADYHYAIKQILNE